MRAEDELTASYLRRLKRALRGVPRGRRTEILEEVAAHLAEARVQAADEAELRTLIDRLGDPAEIAAEAREARGPAPRRGWVEIVALAMLSVGSLLPVIGWLVGVVLLLVLATSCHGPGFVVRALAAAACVAPLFSVVYLAWRARDHAEAAGPMGAALPSA